MLFYDYVEKQMEKKKLKEQHAPEKNTDRAFVKVNRDGTPAMPVQKKQNHSEHERSRKQKGR
jgi:hypothetical protein